jgi:death-on-curing protein
MISPLPTSRAPEVETRMNHGFVDGNKRVAFAATYVFLRINGMTINAPVDAILEFVIGSLEKGFFQKSLLEVWLRANTD